MRLALLRKLEARASTVKRAAAGAGIVWSRDDVRVTRELEPGELAAVDMHVAVPEGESPAVVRMVERVTLDAWDLGFRCARGDCHRVRSGATRMETLRAFRRAPGWRARLLAGDAAEVRLPFALGVDDLIGHGADRGICAAVVGFEAFQAG